MENSMHILAFILLFIIMSVIAACGGDFSGLKVVGEVAAVVALFFVFGWLILNPVFLVIVIIAIILIAIGSFSSK